MQAIVVSIVCVLSFLMQNAVVANDATEKRFAAMERRMLTLEADNVLLRRELHAMKSEERKHLHRFDLILNMRLNCADHRFLTLCSCLFAWFNTVILMDTVIRRRSVQ